MLLQFTLGSIKRQFLELGDPASFIVSQIAQQRGFRHPNQPRNFQMRVPLTFEIQRYAERLMRAIKEEEVDLSEYRNFAEAREGIGRFLEEDYLEKRMHSSLGYLTPSEYEKQWNKLQNQKRDTKEESP
jgi:transposase InsO family protein